jgi:hypothetical protein
MLHKVLLLDLMAVAPLLIGTEEEEEAGGDILEVTTTSIMGNLTVATMRVPPGIITIVVVHYKISQFYRRTNSVSV